MATNERFGTTLRVRKLPVAAGTVSGAPVLVGAIPGIALTDRAVSGNGAGGNIDGQASVALNGAWDVSVTGAIAGSGVAVYITSGGALTATASGNTLWGYSVPGVTADGSKGSGAGLLTVEISQV